MRSGRKMLLKDMRSDGFYPNLIVDPAWYDSKHPQESLPEIEDPIALWRPAPERSGIGDFNLVLPIYDVITDTFTPDLFFGFFLQGALVQGINPPFYLGTVSEPLMPVQFVPFSFDMAPHFEDPQGFTLTFSAINLPTGLSIDTAGLITGTNTDGADSTATITVTSTSGLTGMTDIDFDTQSANLLNLGFALYQGVTTAVDGTISNGGRTVTLDVAATRIFIDQKHFQRRGVDDLIYFEVTIDDDSGLGELGMISVDGAENTSLTANAFRDQHYWSYNDIGQARANAGLVGTFGTWIATDVINIAFRISTNEVWVGINGVYQGAGSPNPSTLTDPTVTFIGNKQTHFAVGSNAIGAEFTLNSGEDAFNNTIPTSFTPARTYRESQRFPKPCTSPRLKSAQIELRDTGVAPIREVAHNVAFNDGGMYWDVAFNDPLNIAAGGLGRFYFEVEINGGDFSTGVGVCGQGANPSSALDGNGSSVVIDGAGTITRAGVLLFNDLSTVAGEIIAVAIDMRASVEKIWFGRDNTIGPITWIGSGTQDPATNQGGYDIFEVAVIEDDTYIFLFCGTRNTGALEFVFESASLVYTPPTNFGELILHPFIGDDYVFENAFDFVNIDTTMTVARQVLNEQIAASNQMTYALTSRSTGQFYFEVTDYLASTELGVHSNTGFPDENNALSLSANCAALIVGNVRLEGANTAIAGTHQVGTTYGCAFDADLGRAWFHINGVYQGPATQDPATNQGGFDFTQAGPYRAAVSQSGGNETEGCEVNFGNTGRFAFAAPSGFIAWEP